MAYQVIGKGYGWDIDYCRQQKQYERILEGFAFINHYHDAPIYMENIQIIDGNWKIIDAGNGEQTAWWCWAIARLRKELGMKVVPEKIDN